MILKFAQPLLMISIVLGFQWTQASYQSGVVAAPMETTNIGSPVPAKNDVATVMKIVREYKGQIKKAARAFGIDPIHIAAAIAGEHARHVDTWDSLQDYFIQTRNSVNYFVSTHSRDAEKLYTLMKSQKLSTCNKNKSDYYYWHCVISKSPQRSTKKFNRTYFNPNNIGSTFGVGQMSPVRALMVSDLVARNTSLEPLSFRYDGDVESAYEAVIDPNKVAYYIAATISYTIRVYQQVAHFDISDNPAITATLYNVGNESYVAKKKYDANMKRLQKGQPIEYPMANEMGQWVLQNIDRIEAAIQ